MVACVVIAMRPKPFGIEITRFESVLDPKRGILYIGVLKIELPDLKKHLASRPCQRYNTPNLHGDLCGGICITAYRFQKDVHIHPPTFQLF